MKSILVTGFGPFGDHKINASWEAVKLLPDELEKFKIVKMEIPVAYHIVETKIPELWNEFDPEVSKKQVNVVFGEIERIKKHCFYPL